MSNTFFQVGEIQSWPKV